ncbi:MAG: DinB family protein [Thermomicrobiales bacterium]
MATAFMGGEISRAVVDFAGRLARVGNETLTARWPEPGREGHRWHGYLETARDVALHLNLMLNRLTCELLAGRSLDRPALICAVHHRAYRDLTGALVAVDDEEFDRPPDEREWPIRTVISHITDAELGFSLLIDWAVERSRMGDDRPIEMARSLMEPHYERLQDAGDMDAMMSQYESLHRGVISNLLDLAPADLDAMNVWWEGYEIPVWFRMHRFEAHLREHVIQIDKALGMLGRSPTEAERLARLLHQSLADLEVALLFCSSGGTATVVEQAAEFDRCRLLLQSI